MDKKDMVWALSKSDDCTWCDIWGDPFDHGYSGFLYLIKTELELYKNAVPENTKVTTEWGIHILFIHDASGTSYVTYYTTVGYYAYPFELLDEETSIGSLQKRW